jgi:stage II sporulation protein D
VVSAAPVADHVAASRSEIRSDQTVRVLLGRGASGETLGRDESGFAVWKGRRFRGTIELVPDGAGLSVINRVDLEDYLRGVLPEEIGSRDPRDRAALQAQAVAARSYVAARMGERRPVYDVTATVADQVYGGQSVERPATDDAVRDTRGLVLTWGDRIITAPYHAHGGEVTAAPAEVWKRASEPYLQPVNDRTAGGGCFCDASGNRGWERRFSFGELESLLLRHGREAGVSAVGVVRAVRVSSRGPSGRVTATMVAS